MEGTNTAAPANGDISHPKADIINIFSVVQEHGTGNYNPAGNRRPKSRRNQNGGPPIGNDTREPNHNIEESPERCDYATSIGSDETIVKTPLTDSDRRDDNRNQNKTIEEDPMTPNKIPEGGEESSNNKTNYEPTPDGAVGTDENYDTDVEVLAGVDNPDELFQDERWAVSGDRESPDDATLTSDSRDKETIVQTLRDSTVIEDLDSKWDVSKTTDDFVVADDDLIDKSKSAESDKDDDVDNSIQDWDFDKIQEKNKDDIPKAKINETDDDLLANDNYSDNSSDAKWIDRENGDAFHQRLDAGMSHDASVASNMTPSLARTLVVQDTRLEEMDDFTGAFAGENETEV